MSVDEEEALQTELAKLEQEEERQKQRKEKIAVLKQKVEEKKKVVSDLQGEKRSQVYRAFYLHVGPLLRFQLDHWQVLEIHKYLSFVLSLLSLNNELFPFVCTILSVQLSGLFSLE